MGSKVPQPMPKTSNKVSPPDNGKVQVGHNDPATNQERTVPPPPPPPPKKK